jgi:hypothetical protein
LLTLRLFKSKKNTIIIEIKSYNRYPYYSTNATINNIYIYIKQKKKKIMPKNQKIKTKRKETEPPGLGFGECIVGALFLDGVDQLGVGCAIKQPEGVVVVVPESEI